MKLGVIADDFTGAVDIAGFLAKSGMRTALWFSLDQGADLGSYDAIVACLKIRSCKPAFAVSQALDALWKLRSCGCDTIYYKYCSTFDCTQEGNIGQVIDALREATGCTTTVVCPSLPVNGRTVYNGYLFVNDTLLGESSMRQHPLNPMTESKLSRLLAHHSDTPSANIHLQDLHEGPAYVAALVQRYQDQGVGFLIMDAIEQSDLDIIAKACDGMALYTGGSALGEAIALLHAPSSSRHNPGMLQLPKRGVVLSGSCSAMTNRQVQEYRKVAANVAVDMSRISERRYVQELVSWVLDQQGTGSYPLVYSTTTQVDDPSLSCLLETLFSDLAVCLYQGGMRSFIIAGGETSSSVVKALEIDSCELGPMIAPGVSWVHTAGNGCFFALKSGNFGDEQFFFHAQRMMEV